MAPVSKDATPKILDPVVGVVAPITMNVQAADDESNVNLWQADENLFQTGSLRMYDSTFPVNGLTGVGGMWSSWQHEKKENFGQRVDRTLWHGTGWALADGMDGIWFKFSVNAECPKETDGLVLDAAAESVKACTHSHAEARDLGCPWHVACY
ncbi:hypothetical protein Nepgr_027191 [Nepenthes gracilis]|uniref:Uncharacterized protein n=1 Tax=Nepenthes gracilis TaxID=150966 RepID=A0AAD3Y191_NEPGR|nr:hypothetical protein Nepgr_027191 [Nepenthes gracilis]